MARRGLRGTCRCERQPGHYVPAVTTPYYTPYYVPAGARGSRASIRARDRARSRARANLQVREAAGGRLGREQQLVREVAEVVRRLAEPG